MKLVKLSLFLSFFLFFHDIFFVFGTDVMLSVAKNVDLLLLQLFVDSFQCFDLFYHRGIGKTSLFVPPLGLPASKPHETVFAETFRLFSMVFPLLMHSWVLSFVVVCPGFCCLEAAFVILALEGLFSEP